MNYQKFIYWLRTSHGWIGLWGAVLGLLFGFSGIWLNHRNILKLPVAHVRTNAQIALPDPIPASTQEMSVWLQKTLALNSPANSMRVEHAKPLPWGDKAMQPERWVFNFGGPDNIIQADYWSGNRSVGITTTANGFIGTLTSLHKGTGMTVPWILLIDTLAGSMIFLSISGVLLWVQTNRRRAIGATIFTLSSSLALLLAYLRLSF
jgi:uncharacterized protein